MYNEYYCLPGPYTEISFMGYESSSDCVKIRHYKWDPQYNKFDLLYYIIVNVIYDEKTDKLSWLV